MTKALVVYVGRKGSNPQIAELIPEGIRMSGAESEVTDIALIRNETDLQGYDALVFGSATYHGEMMQPMKTMLFLAEKAGLEGKVGGAFGAFGWSGEAPDRIFNTMLHILNMKMASAPLRLKNAAWTGGGQMAQDYGRQIARKLSE